MIHHGNIISTLFSDKSRENKRIVSSIDICEDLIAIGSNDGNVELRTLTNNELRLHTSLLAHILLPSALTDVIFHLSSVTSSSSDDRKEFHRSVTCIRISPNLEKLAFGTALGDIYAFNIKDIHTSYIIGSHSDHKGYPIRSICWSPNSEFLVSGCEYGKVIEWSLNSMKYEDKSSFGWAKSLLGLRSGVILHSSRYSIHQLHIAFKRGLHSSTLDNNDYNSNDNNSAMSDTSSLSEYLLLIATGNQSILLDIQRSLLSINHLECIVRKTVKIETGIHRSLSLAATAFSGSYVSSSSYRKASGFLSCRKGNSTGPEFVFCDVEGENYKCLNLKFMSCEVSIPSFLNNRSSCRHYVPSVASMIESDRMKPFGFKFTATSNLSYYKHLLFVITDEKKLCIINMIEFTIQFFPLYPNSTIESISVSNNKLLILRHDWESSEVFIDLFEIISPMKCITPIEIFNSSIYRALRRIQRQWLLKSEENNHDIIYNWNDDGMVDTLAAVGALSAPSTFTSSNTASSEFYSIIRGESKNSNRSVSMDSTHEYEGDNNNNISNNNSKIDYSSESSNRQKNLSNYRSIISSEFVLKYQTVENMINKALMIADLDMEDAVFNENSQMLMFSDFCSGESGGSWNIDDIAMYGLPITTDGQGRVRSLPQSIVEQLNSLHACVNDDSNSNNNNNSNSNSNNSKSLMSSERRKSLEEIIRATDSNDDILSKNISTQLIRDRSSSSASSSSSTTPSRKSSLSSSTEVLDFPVRSSRSNSIIDNSNHIVSHSSGPLNLSLKNKFISRNSKSEESSSSLLNYDFNSDNEIPSMDQTLNEVLHKIDMTLSLSESAIVYSKTNLSPVRGMNILLNNNHSNHNLANTVSIDSVLMELDRMISNSNDILHRSSLTDDDLYSNPIDTNHDGHNSDNYDYKNDNYNDNDTIVVMNSDNAVKDAISAINQLFESKSLKSFNQKAESKNKSINNSTNTSPTATTLSIDSNSDEISIGTSRISMNNIPLFSTHDMISSSDISSTNNMINQRIRSQSTINNMSAISSKSVMKQNSIPVSITLKPQLIKISPKDSEESTEDYSDSGSDSSSDSSIEFIHNSDVCWIETWWNENVNGNQTHKNNDIFPSVKKRILDSRLKKESVNILSIVPVDVLDNQMNNIHPKDVGIGSVLFDRFKPISISNTRYTGSRIIHPLLLQASDRLPINSVVVMDKVNDLCEVTVNSLPPMVYEVNLYAPLGLGITLLISPDGILTIQSFKTLSNGDKGPAELCGLIHIGDQVISINGEILEGIGLERLSQLLESFHFHHHRNSNYTRHTHNHHDNYTGYLCIRLRSYEAMGTYESENREQYIHRISSNDSVGSSKNPLLDLLGPSFAVSVGDTIESPNSILSDEDGDGIKEIESFDHNNNNNDNNSNNNNNSSSSNSQLISTNQRDDRLSLNLEALGMYIGVYTDPLSQLQSIYGDSMILNEKGINSRIHNVSNRSGSNTWRSIDNSSYNNSKNHKRSISDVIIEEIKSNHMYPESAVTSLIPPKPPLSYRSDIQSLDNNDDLLESLWEWQSLQYKTQYSEYFNDKRYPKIMRTNPFVIQNNRLYPILLEQESNYKERITSKLMTINWIDSRLIIDKLEDESNRTRQLSLPESLKSKKISYLYDIHMDRSMNQIYQPESEENTESYDYHENKNKNKNKNKSEDNNAREDKERSHFYTIYQILSEERMKFGNRSLRTYQRKGNNHQSKGRFIEFQSQSSVVSLPFSLLSLSSPNILFQQNPFDLKNIHSIQIAYDSELGIYLPDYNTTIQFLVYIIDSITNLSQTSFTTDKTNLLKNQFIELFQVWFGLFVPLPLQYRSKLWLSSSEITSDYAYSHGFLSSQDMSDYLRLIDELVSLYIGLKSLGMSLMENMIENMMESKGNSPETVHTSITTMKMTNDTYYHTEKESYSSNRPNPTSTVLSNWFKFFPCGLIRLSIISLSTSTPTSKDDSNNDWSNLWKDSDVVGFIAKYGSYLHLDFILHCSGVCNNVKVMNILFEVLSYDKSHSQASLLLTNILQGNIKLITARNLLKSLTDIIGKDSCTIYCNLIKYLGTLYRRDEKLATDIAALSFPYIRPSFVKYILFGDSWLTRVIPKDDSSNSNNCTNDVVNALEDWYSKARKSYQAYLQVIIKRYRCGNDPVIVIEWLELLLYLSQQENLFSVKRDKESQDLSISSKQSNSNTDTVMYLYHIHGIIQYPEIFRYESYDAAMICYQYNYVEGFVDCLRDYYMNPIHSKPSDVSNQSTFMQQNESIYEKLLSVVLIKSETLYRCICQVHEIASTLTSNPINGNSNCDTNNQIYLQQLWNNTNEINKLVMKAFRLLWISIERKNVNNTSITNMSSQGLDIFSEVIGKAWDSITVVETEENIVSSIHRHDHTSAIRSSFANILASSLLQSIGQSLTKEVLKRNINFVQSLTIRFYRKLNSSSSS